MITSKALECLPASHIKEETAKIQMLNAIPYLTDAFNMYTISDWTKILFASVFLVHVLLGSLGKI